MDRELIVAFDEWVSQWYVGERRMGESHSLVLAYSPSRVQALEIREDLISRPKAQGFSSRL